MYFLTCRKNKVILGWSAKSGCSHIKRIFRYLAYNQNISDHNAIHSATYNHLPGNISEYTIILVVRNPYTRLVSGFREKYNPDPNSSGTCYKMWNIDKTLTFSNFVDEIVKKNWTVIHEHHFVPHISEAYQKRIESHDKLFVYDLANINYQQFETLFKKTIPQELLDYRGGHENTRTDISEKYVYDDEISTYNQFVIHTKYFYSDEILAKVNEFYKDDFELFNRLGFNYTI